MAAAFYMAKSLSHIVKNLQDKESKSCEPVLFWDFCVCGLYHWFGQACFCVNTVLI